MSDLEFTAISARICGNCGTDTRHPNGHCKLCTRAEVRAWKDANPEKQEKLDEDAKNIKRAKNRAYAAEKYAKNPAPQKQASQHWRKENPEKVNARSRVRRAERTIDVILLHAERRSTKEHRERQRALHDAWRKTNKSALKIIDHNYRARKKFNGGKLSTGLAEKLFELQKGMCACCGQPLGGDYHLDHIQPLALGGPNTDDNIQLLRQRCNNQKGKKHPVTFMQERGFLL